VLVGEPLGRCALAVQVLLRIGSASRAGHVALQKPWFLSVSFEGFSSIAPFAYFRSWYDASCAPPPAGYTYTLRSLRSGFASGAISIGVQSGRVNYVGGWVPGSPTMDRFYVDYTFVAYGYARWFFGHLLVA